MMSNLTGMSDFIFRAGTEPLGPGSFMCLSVLIVDDQLIEDGEMFVVCGRSKQPAVELLDGGCATVFIEDNDEGKLVF